jgi:hypothetical protein
MSDPAQSPQAPSADQTSPPGSTQAQTTAPDGKDSTLLTAPVDAPGTSDEAGKTTEKDPPAEAPPPFDSSKLTFPEELGKPDDEVLGKFGEIAKSANLTQEAAQQLADIYSNSIKASAEASRKAWESAVEAWEKEVKADPNIGGDKWDSTRANIAKIFDDPRFSTPGLREALNFTGAGNHPALVRFMAKVAAVLTEGSAVHGDPSTAKRTPRTAAQSLYPDLPSSESGA